MSENVTLSRHMTCTVLAALLPVEADDRAQAEAEAADPTLVVSDTLLGIRSNLAAAVEHLAAALWLPDALPVHRAQQLVYARERFAQRYPSLAVWTDK